MRHASRRHHHRTSSTVSSKPTGTSTTTAAASGAGGGSSAPVLGTFGISTSAQMTQWAAAGGNAIVIPVYWQAAQPTALGPVSLSAAGNNGDNVVTEIAHAHAAGLAVYLELDLQYPPQWVLDQVPGFVNQAGTAYTSTNPGANVRDWVWSAAGRQAVASFVSRAIGDLKSVLGDVSGIRAGGGMYGELQFPIDGSSVNGQPSYWGYGQAAQSGVGIASGETATPLPGYVYGTGSSAQDAEWASWYLGSLASWIHWYVLQLRGAGWNGPIYVLHPSFGLRTNWSPESAAYEQQLAQGTDPATMMDAYDSVANVWPWCTWADDTEPFWIPGDTIDSDMAAWRKLLVLAQARGLASHILGENTGGGGSAAIQQLMSGALASGYKGVFYLDYSYLVTNGLLGDLVSEFKAYAP